MAYVAYTNGLGVLPGEAVDPANFDESDWDYHVARGNVVKQGSEHDPSILAARAAGEDYTDPRDARIAELEAELLKSQGLSKSPASGSFVGTQEQKEQKEQKVSSETEPEVKQE